MIDRVKLKKLPLFIQRYLQLEVREILAPVQYDLLFLERMPDEIAEQLQFVKDKYLGRVGE